MKALFIIPVLIILSLSACVTTVQPLVRAKHMITDNRLTGTWNQQGTEVKIEPYNTSEFRSTLAKKFRQGDNPLDQNQESIEQLKGSYVVSYKKNDRTYNLMLSLIRINDLLFCNVLPVGIDDSSDEDAGLGVDNEFLAGYTIARVTITGQSSIALEFLDGDMIRKQVLAGNMRLKHEYDPLFGTFLITAGTDELQQFIGKYGNDKRFFTEQNSIILTRKG